MTQVIEVVRTRHNCKTEKETVSISYYVSNYSQDNQKLVCAIRNHWSIEVSNRVRDENFGEDYLLSFDYGRQKSISSFLTFIFDGFYRDGKPKNLNAKREEVSDSYAEVESFFAA